MLRIEQPVAIDVQEKRAGVSSLAFALLLPTPGGGGGGSSHRSSNVQDALRDHPRFTHNLGNIDRVVLPITVVRVELIPVMSIIKM
tara:strand:+ start:240 stop:497 length:258 start_codon:yes stop_codon:yes gene_type:complete